MDIVFGIKATGSPSRKEERQCLSFRFSPEQILSVISHVREALVFAERSLLTYFRQHVRVNVNKSPQL